MIRKQFEPVTEYVAQRLRETRFADRAQVIKLIELERFHLGKHHSCSHHIKLALIAESLPEESAIIQKQVSAMDIAIRDVAINRDDDRNSREFEEQREREAGTRTRADDLAQALEGWLKAGGLP